MSENEYVIQRGLRMLEGIWDTPEGAQANAVESDVVCKLGPEVERPDYGPLVEWVRGGRDVLHKASCGVVDHLGFCDFERALRAALIE